MNERTRAYIYRVLVSASPLVTAYGVMAEQDAALWLALAATILGVGLAAVNTSTDKVTP